MEAVEAPRTARARSVSEDLDELLQRAQRQLIFAFVQCFASSSLLSILFAIEETQTKTVKPFLNSLPIISTLQY